MQIVETRAAIAERLRGALGPTIPVSIHPFAKMDAKWLEVALRNVYLSVHVAFLGNPREDAEESTDEVDAPFVWAAYLCAKDGEASKLRRDELILGALPAVMLCIAQNAQLDEALNTHAPEQIRSFPVYEGEVGSNSSMIWAVTWRQTSSLRPVYGDVLPLNILNTSYDLAPKEGVIDATDHIEMRVSDE